MKHPRILLPLLLLGALTSSCVKDGEIKVKGSGVCPFVATWKATSSETSIYDPDSGALIAEQTVPTTGQIIIAEDGAGFMSYEFPLYEWEYNGDIEWTYTKKDRTLVIVSKYPGTDDLVFTIEIEECDEGSQRWKHTFDADYRPCSTCPTEVVRGERFINLAIQ